VVWLIHKIEHKKHPPIPVGERHKDKFNLVIIISWPVRFLKP